MEAGGLRPPAKIRWAQLPGDSIYPPDPHPMPSTLYLQSHWEESRPRRKESKDAPQPAPVGSGEKRPGVQAQQGVVGAPIYQQVLSAGITVRGKRVASGQKVGPGLSQADFPAYPPSLGELGEAVTFLMKTRRTFWSSQLKVVKNSWSPVGKPLS